MAFVENEISIPLVTIIIIIIISLGIILVNIFLGKIK